MRNADALFQALPPALFKISEGHIFQLANKLARSLEDNRRGEEHISEVSER